MFHIFLLNPPCFHRLFPGAVPPLPPKRLLQRRSRPPQSWRSGPRGTAPAPVHSTHWPCSRGGNWWEKWWLMGEIPSKLDKELRDDGKLDKDFLLDE